MSVTVSDEKLIEELSKVADEAEVRAANGRVLGVFVSASGRDRVRDHGAFLASYAPEDEGLYDVEAGR